MYAAARKLLDLPAFREELYRQPFPRGVANALLYLLPLAELTVVALLLMDKTLAAGLQASLSLLIIFTGYILLIKLHFWAQIPCSCGGILGRMSWGAHLLFNLCFIAVNLLAFRIYFRDQRTSG